MCMHGMVVYRRCMLPGKLLLHQKFIASVENDVSLHWYNSFGWIIVSLQKSR